MELIKHGLWVLRRRWYVPVTVFALVAIIVAVMSVGAGVKMTATTTLFLRSPDSDSSSSAYQGDLFTRQRGLTYVDFVQSPELARKVIERLSLPESPGELIAKTTASIAQDTVLLQISVTDPDAQHAADIANGYGEEMAAYIAEMENIRDPDIAPLAVQLAPAQADAAVSSGMGPTFLAAIGLAAGVLIILALLWLLEWLDPRVRSRREVEDLSQAPVLATYRSLDGPEAAASAQGSGRRHTVEISDADLQESGRTGRLAVTAVSRIESAESMIVVVGSRERAVEAVADVLRKAVAERGRDVVVEVASADIGSALTAEAVARADAAIVVVSGPETTTRLRYVVRELDLLSTRLIGTVVTGVRQADTPSGLYR